jgi:t-SNARE complex subunit (syntaxin)
MKATLLVFLFAIACFKNVCADIFQQFDKPSYYKILKSGSVTEINNEIELIDASSLKNKDAFTGALMMKKAGLLKVPKEKLDNFKKGATKLETVLRSDTSNVEYRFLRLIIQEHAPKVVKYSKNISEDVAFIKKNYKELSPEVQKTLIDYSQTSKALKPQDFQP